MKQVYLQYWEESERGWGVRPDGCSLHLSKEGNKKYIESIWESRKDFETIPNEYDRSVGEIVDVFIKDGLYELLEKETCIRLMQHELGNLLKLEEITII